MNEHKQWFETVSYPDLTDQARNHEYHEVYKGDHCPLCYLKQNLEIQDHIDNNNNLSTV